MPRKKIESLEEIKTAVATPVEEKTTKKSIRDKQGRSYATGKRKDAVARVWIMPGKGNITINENIINMVTNMFVLSMSFLCGVFIDLQFLSPSIVKVAHFLPLYWYTAAILFINDTPVDPMPYLP